MSVKPDFAAMTSQQLRAYVLEHRDDEAALQSFLDRRRSENLTPRVYRAEDDVAEAVAEYLERKRQQEAS
jgi:hypothetical protein